MVAEEQEEKRTGSATMTAATMTAATRARATCTCSSSSPWRACAKRSPTWAARSSWRRRRLGRARAQVAGCGAREAAARCAQAAAQQGVGLAAGGVRAARAGGGSSRHSPPIIAAMRRSSSTRVSRAAGVEARRRRRGAEELLAGSPGVVVTSAFGAGPRQLRAERVYQQGVRRQHEAAHAHHHRGRRARRHGVRRPLEHRGLQLGSCAPTPAPTPGPANCVQSACTSHGDCSKACGPSLETRTHTTTTYAAHGGTACGSLSDYAACNLGSCAPTPVLTSAPSTA